MDRVQKTSRYFLEHLVPREALDPAQNNRLRVILSDEDEQVVREFAKELAESLADRGFFEKLGDSQFRDPRSGARFRFPSTLLGVGTAPAPSPPVAEVKAGRALRPPRSDELEAIYDEVLSAIRLEESKPGAEPGLTRLLGLLDRWVSKVDYQLYCFIAGSDIPEQFAGQILVLEPETLETSHPYRQVVRRKIALQLDADDPAFLGFPQRAKEEGGSVYLLPLFLDGKPWGILDIHLPGNEAGDNLEGKLQLLASALTHQIYNHRILSKVVFVDWTTQVYNRTFLEIQLPLEIEKAKRNEVNLALLVLDLDDFKRVNDRWGHDRGDQALREFAAVLKKTFRRVDQIYRFGGEEFVVLLPGLDQEGAARAAERLIEAVRANAFLEDVSKGELKLTASIGGSIYPDQADNETQLFRLADESCYRAKHEGKDRVVFSSP